MHLSNLPPAGLLGLLLAAAAPAQSHKVSGALALSPGTLGGDVREARFTPDGSHVVYLADQDTVGTVDLYSAPPDGSSAPVKLSSVDPDDVQSYQISSDGGRVVFSDATSLFSAPIDGSAPTVELTPYHSGYQITPDGTHVVWFAGSLLAIVAIDGGGPPLFLDTGNVDPDFTRLMVSPDGERAVLATRGCTYLGCSAGLFSVLLDGSQPAICLVPPESPGFDALGFDFAITPDSQRVVFYGTLSDGFCGASNPPFGLRAGDGQVNAIFSVPIGGATRPTKLSDTIPTGSPVHFEVTPNSERVVYVAFSGASEVYSVPVDGSAAPVKLNGPLVTGGQVAPSAPWYPPFQITPDGTHVVYRADQLVYQRFELFSVPVVGGPATRISGAMAAGGSVFDFQVSPDSSGVVFSADRVVDGVVELFGVPFGGGVFQLSPGLVAGGNVFDFQISPDGAYVIYRADQQVDEIVELFTVATTGGPSTKISGTLVSGGDVRFRSWLVSPDSTRVAYLADQEIDEVLEVFGAPIAAAGASVRLNDPLDPGPPSGDVARYAVTPDSSTALYVADGDEEDVFELYRAPVAGGSVVKLSGTLVSGGDVQDLRITPDGARSVYRADQNVNNRSELFSVPLDGSQAPLRLTSFGDVRSYDLTPDGTRVLYLAQFGGLKLYSVPIDGSQAPVQFSSAGQALQFQISPDGTRVVYRTYFDLYSAPTDGSQPAVKLNGRFGPDSGSYHVMLGPSFQISPDGKRVVYVADSMVDTHYELFSVAIDGEGGGGRSVRLNAPLPPGGDVLQFEISPAGKRVVYYADQEVDERYELYSVPIEGTRPLRRADGSSIPGRVKLNGPLAAGGIVGYGCCYQAGFAISPNGSRVAFSAQSIDRNHHDLFITAIDGSQAPLPITSGHFFVGDFRFSPGGERVVYLTTAVLSGIYSALVDGSQPPARLSEHPGPFSISPDGKWVVLRADRDVAGQFELFGAPIDGSLDPIQLNGPFTADGDIGGTNGDWVTPMLLITPDSGHVLYGADQELDEVFELYATPLPALP